MLTFHREKAHLILERLKKQHFDHLDTNTEITQRKTSFSGFVTGS